MSTLAQLMFDGAAVFTAHGLMKQHALLPLEAFKAIDDADLLVDHLDETQVMDPPVWNASEQLFEQLRLQVTQDTLPGMRAYCQRRYEQAIALHQVTVEYRRRLGMTLLKSLQCIPAGRLPTCAGVAGGCPHCTLAPWLDYHHDGRFDNVCYVYKNMAEQDMHKERLIAALHLHGDHVEEEYEDGWSSGSDGDDSADEDYEPEQD